MLQHQQPNVTTDSQEPIEAEGAYRPTTGTQVPTLPPKEDAEATGTSGRRHVDTPAGVFAQIIGVNPPPGKVAFFAWLAWIFVSSCAAIFTETLDPTKIEEFINFIRVSAYMALLAVGGLAVYYVLLGIAFLCKVCYYKAFPRK